MVRRQEILGDKKTSLRTPGASFFLTTGKKKNKINHGK
jgi:hypothetical protein